MKSKIIILSFNLFFLCALMRLSSADDTYSLKRIYKAGDVDRYQVSIKVEGTYTPEDVPGAKSRKVMQEITGILLQKTREVRNDGSIILDTQIESGSTKSDEGQQSLDTIGKSVVTGWDKDGNPYRPIGDSQAIADILQLETLPGLNIKLPHPMKIGDEAPFELACGFTNDQKITGTIQLVSLEKKVDNYSGSGVKVKMTGAGAIVAYAGTDMEKDPKDPTKMIPKMIKNEKQSFKLDVSSLVDPVNGKTIQLDGKLSSPRFANISDVTITYKRYLLKK
jgi:hypothetical protein